MNFITKICLILWIDLSCDLHHFINISQQVPSYGNWLILSIRGDHLIGRVVSVPTNHEIAGSIPGTSTILNKD